MCIKYVSRVAWACAGARAYLNNVTRAHTRPGGGRGDGWGLMQGLGRGSCSGVRRVGRTLADLTLARRGPTLATTLVRPRSEVLFLWSEDLFVRRRLRAAVGL